MIGFIVSTIAFSIALYALNKHHSIEKGDDKHPHRLRVLLLATLVSLGAGWLTDELDGDAKKPQPSMSEVIMSDDPTQIAKSILGING